MLNFLNKILTNICRTRIMLKKVTPPHFKEYWSLWSQRGWWWWWLTCFCIGERTARCNSVRRSLSILAFLDLTNEKGKNCLKERRLNQQFSERDVNFTWGWQVYEWTSIIRLQLNKVRREFFIMHFFSADYGYHVMRVT